MTVTFFIHPLSLAENAISNKGAKALSRALLVNRTLTSLKWDLFVTFHWLQMNLMNGCHIWVHKRKLVGFSWTKLKLGAPPKEKDPEKKGGLQRSITCHNTLFSLNAGMRWEMTDGCESIQQLCVIHTVLQHIHCWHWLITIFVTIVILLSPCQRQLYYIHVYYMINDRCWQNIHLVSILIHISITFYTKEYQNYPHLLLLWRNIQSPFRFWHITLEWSGAF